MSVLLVPDLDEEPWPTLGPQVADLLETYSIFGPGSLQGQPYVLDDEKRAALYRAYEVYPRGHRWAGRRRFKRVGISWRKGLAKALALDTPIPTPGGWSRMGDLQVGDQVFDETGAVRKVVAASGVFLGSDCYRVTFRDGSSIVADAEHRWYTEELRHRHRADPAKFHGYVGSVKTTTQLAPSVTTRADGALNHRIPVAAALDLPDADLLVDPWVLGAWLGDGRTDDSEFSMHADDHPNFVSQIERAGYHHQAPKVDRRTGVYDVRVSSAQIRRGGPPRGRSLKRDLRALGVLGDKHIPTAYLRASRAQRLALLQGLMDTDGTIAVNGDIAFVSTLHRLATQVHELMCSLGLKPTIRPAATRGKPAWRIFVHADSSMPLFTLHRKAERQRRPATRTAMSRNRHVVSVEPVESVPTRCIAVDAPSRLFLAGEAMVPTHNTEFGAEIAFAELHPEGPVRCDGFDASGQPVGRPVASPYIPMLAVTVEQVEELAYGALFYICTEGPDADLFDATLERINRLDERGRADGRAVPLANNPGSRDGARTTFQLFDEPHRLHLPRQVEAHETMAANLEKRVLEDPWGLYVGTAGEPGQGSVAEGLHREAELIAAGKINEPRLFYFHRQAGEHNLDDFDERMDAVAEATGPVGEYGPGQFHSIASQWDRPGADKAYLERVWLNRWVRSGAQAFDVKRFEALGPAKDAAGEPLEERALTAGAFITLGFDGARFKDATALVATDIPSGLQQLVGLWERPPDRDEWEVPEDEVDDVLEDTMRRFKVWKLYADPPHWVETVGKWAGKYPDQVVEWWTFHRRPMGMAIRAYQEAIDSGALTHTGDAELIRHVGNAGRVKTNLVDDEGKTIFILGKIAEERKFDAAMAAILSWRARLDALAAGAKPPQSSTAGFYVPYRVR